MSFRTIGNALYTKLLEIKNTDLRVWEVFNYDPKLKDIWMPCIIISPVDWDENIYDTCSNETTYNFSIRTIDETDNIATVEDNIRWLADIVLEKLKDVWDVTFTNWFTRKLTFTYNWWWIDEQQPLRVFEVIARFTALEDK